MRRRRGSGRGRLLISKAECLVTHAAQWHEEGFFGRVIDASNEALDVLMLVVESDEQGAQGVSGVEDCVLRLASGFRECGRCSMGELISSVLRPLAASLRLRRLLGRSWRSQSSWRRSQRRQGVAGSTDEPNGYVRRLFVLAERSARQVHSSLQRRRHWRRWRGWIWDIFTLRSMPPSTTSCCTSSQAQANARLDSAAGGCWQVCAGSAAAGLDECACLQYAGSGGDDAPISRRLRNTRLLLRHDWRRAARSHG
ncbi:hypothetical protein DL89DRAFT_2915 [Linderina pennispora]|uniref:Uncharacterized protein n=1 Tax=Linderina pennispora TaxID=61395 RepID=A0A1Y1WJK1_9FUNG|nr:uncharacterized protein DL89DRAFT_2915 [Linderina pennispora]ORX73719.1 hypothetical protein DL89DRAFT_2915 [Linderina pennispora]